MQIGAAEFVL